MNTKTVPSLFVTSEATLSYGLGYLFSVVLKTDGKVLHDFDEAEHYLSGVHSMDLVFIHAQSSEDNIEPIIRQAKTNSAVPVVIVMLNDGVDLGAEAFLAGADDVVKWPCSLHELAVRLHVRLGLDPCQDLFPDSDVNWETEAYIADRAGLTTAEAQVLRVLYSHDGEIVSRDDLSYAVDARPWRYGDRKFDVHVAKIRKKLSDTFGSQMSVSTIRSSGYQLSTQGYEFS